MSFQKIAIIENASLPYPPEDGHVYIGYDSGGLWVMDQLRNIIYVSSGGTGPTSDWKKIGSDIYYDSGKVGVGTSSTSTEKFRVAGAITIGSADGNTEGSIQYNSTSKDFFGYNGITWMSLTSGGTAMSGATGATYWNDIGSGNIQSANGGNVYIGKIVSTSAYDGDFNVIGKSFLHGTAGAAAALYVNWINTDDPGGALPSGRYSMVVSGQTFSNGYSSYGFTGAVEPGLTVQNNDLANGSVQLSLAGGLVTGIKMRGTNGSDQSFGTGGTDLKSFPSFYYTGATYTKTETEIVVLSATTSAVTYSLSATTYYTDAKVLSAVTYSSGITLSASTYYTDVKSSSAITYSNNTFFDKNSDIKMASGKSVYSDSGFITMSGTTEKAGVTRQFTVGGSTYHFVNGILVEIT